LVIPACPGIYITALHFLVNMPSVCHVPVQGKLCILIAIFMVHLESEKKMLPIFYSFTVFNASISAV
jgi:hypothetical protein